MNSLTKIIIVYSLCFSFSVFGQRSSEASALLDSIKNKISYKANPREIINLSKKLLVFGEKEKDTFLILRALHHLGRRNQFASQNYKSISYFNRELLFFKKKLISKKVKKELVNTEIAPVEIYAQLGNNYSNLGDNKRALEYFNKSKDIAEKENLTFYKAVVPVLIAQINSSVKNYEQAIKNFKLGLFRLENEMKIEEEIRLFNSSLTITQLATTYLLNNNIDSAKTVLNKGFSKNYHKVTPSVSITYKTVEAAILVKENKLTEANTKYKEIEKEAKLLDPNKAILYYYKGYSDCLAKQQKYKEAALVLEEGINELKKDVKEYSLADDYKQIAKYYKADKNIKKSNEYYEKYVLSQTAIEKNKSDVIKIFHDKELKNVNDLKENQKKITSYFIVTSAFIILLLLFFLFKSSKKKKKDSIKFNELLNKIESLEKQQTLVDTKDIQLEEKNTTSDINKETFDEILVGLQKIEEQHYYLKQECNSYNVAKKIKTNTSYLSKVINAHHQKNFNTYINDLRINYVILKLKESSRFRSYSIQSISEEIGYKSPDSFTKYFKRRTGLLPSVYIKKLNSIT